MEYKLDKIEDAARYVLEQIGSRRHVALIGAMGAGKTTLIGAICRQLGVTEPVNSPTFSIVNEYCPETDGEVIYHFDFYRLKSGAEAADIGLDDYLDSGALCLMEWPERIEEALPDDLAVVRIDAIDDDTRNVEVRL